MKTYNPNQLLTDQVEKDFEDISPLGAVTYCKPLRIHGEVYALALIGSPDFTDSGAEIKLTFEVRKLNSQPGELVGKNIPADEIDTFMRSLHESTLDTTAASSLEASKSSEEKEEPALKSYNPDEPLYDQVKMLSRDTNFYGCTVNFAPLMIKDEAYALSLIKAPQTNAQGESYGKTTFTIIKASGELVSQNIPPDEIDSFMKNLHNSAYGITDGNVSTETPTRK